ncbi:tetratricopeptide repeat protein [Maribius pontilimi]|uniref:Tetratricopeptide repeat protein n=1 Tax=Palleronia pontilimi TaxID=1964209 RepID=A0A934IAJ3_9RHOB|nr:tetratricopeptide repeat protein [Palleronia pontilimi]MBJ3762081.1 tetratricopeptide repeat protein [Palleronia pontilimi]
MRNLKSVVAALLLICASPSFAQDNGDGLDDLFTALATAEGADAEKIAAKISSEWSQSGSPAMDVLLSRGGEAMEAGEYRVAVEHLSALIDHAPEFPEAYHLRATAYFNQRRLGLALDDLRVVLALNPRHFGALSGLGVILEEIERPEQALQAWREVARLFPAHPEAERAIARLERLVEGSAL